MPLVTFPQILVVFTRRIITKKLTHITGVNRSTRTGFLYEIIARKPTKSVGGPKIKLV